MAKKSVFILLLVCALFSVSQAAPDKASTDSEAGWIDLFKDQSLKGWKASENQGTFTFRDGMLVVHGPRSHLFYDGPVENANFKNFEFKADIMTMPGSNSGMYFHTKFRPRGWPSKGYEIQVNNSHSDPKRTGGLYGKKDVYEKLVDDKEWFTQHIIVQGGVVTVKVNGKTTITHPLNEKTPPGIGQKLAGGTLALQGHDPKSIVYYKNVMVKPLPPRSAGLIKVALLTGGHGFEQKQFYEMFDSFKGIKYTKIQLKDHSEIFEDITNWDYDVIVLYNMTQKITPKRQENFKKLLSRGIGIVALHHNMGAFQAWPEYKKISGSKYYLKPSEEKGVKFRGSTYKHDIDMKVKIADKNHPITKGLSDFEIHDEGYKFCGFEKDNHVLITTDHEASDKTIGWVRQFDKSAVCGIMLGHDHKAYENKNFRQLLSRAVKWTAGRLK